MFKERRLEPRESLALPLKLSDGSDAVTRDISPSGMYLLIQGDHVIGGFVFFELMLVDAHMKFSSDGQVVRVERRHEHTGIALRLVSPRLEPLR